MALVRHIIGACPSCGAGESYGNVMVGGTTLTRGCLRCRHLEHLPLPPLQKKVIYLDQFFFSHAFRAGEDNEKFVVAQQRISQLALAEKIAAPYSAVHEDESALWDPERRAQLLQFIKQTALGRQFASDFDVKCRQIHRAFESFLKQGPTVQSVERSDAVPKDANEWTGYEWIGSADR